MNFGIDEKLGLFLIVSFKLFRDVLKEVDDGDEAAGADEKAGEAAGKKPEKSKIRRWEEAFVRRLLFWCRLPVHLWRKIRRRLFGKKDH